MAQAARATAGQSSPGELVLGPEIHADAAVGELGSWAGFKTDERRLDLEEIQTPWLSDLQLVDLAGTGTDGGRCAGEWRCVHRAVLDEGRGDIGCSSYRMSTALK